MVSRRQVVDEIIRKLKDPNEHWVFGDLTADHVSGLSIWIGNWLPFIEVYSPNSIGMSIVDKWRVFLAIRVAQRNAVFKKLQGQGNDAKASTTPAN